MKFNDKFLTKEQMEKLPTKRLLAYKNKLMKYHETSNYDDNTISKQDPRWIATYEYLKILLSSREHV